MLKNHVEQEKPQEEELLRRLEDARNAKEAQSRR